MVVGEQPCADWAKSLGFSMEQEKIYLLDDDPDMLALLDDMVDCIGLQAECFSRANHFFDVVGNLQQPSLMVLDLNMPEMDGVEVMRRLSTMQMPPALILVSGHDLSVLHAAVKLGRAHNLTIIDSLVKPISLGSFHRVLATYTKEFQHAVACQHELINSDISSEDLLFAIENKQLVLHYQPQFNIQSNQIIGCEALVRWQHPEKGLIFPDQFIALAEQQKWMGILTNNVIEQAVKQGQVWFNLGVKLPISVNISADNITSLSLPEQVSELLKAEQLYPELLILEITESALMGELVTSLDILTRLRLKGIHLSIDDFGTGYSSLSQLHKIPFTELKIDRSFIGEMLSDPDARAIVKTCILLGHELNMKVVAEGIETEQHVNILRQLGCDIGQGYYYAKPLSAEQMTDKLANHWK
jgi:EAL domain-containing protein (putative c-di-GMP-specific phosphodiesterase class I)/FixJ family two-component response regulator